MVMPSFGAFTGGLDIRDHAFAGLFRQSYLAYALGTERVYAVAGKAYASLYRMMDETVPANSDYDTGRKRLISP